MTRVAIAVANHSVEIEADDMLAAVAAKALYLYRQTVIDADRSTVGFAAPPPIVDRAGPYTESGNAPEFEGK